MRELIGIIYSPWTEKARWALDHHRVLYRYEEHLIIFGMPSLRWKMRRFGLEGPTVPAWVDDTQKPVVRMTDSLAIAQEVDRTYGRVSGETSLFPSGFEKEIERYNHWSETACDAGRYFASKGTLRSYEAKKASLPPFIPGFLRGIFVWLVSIGVAYLDFEFRVGLRKEAEARREGEYREVLLKLRQSLAAARASTGTDYLLGGKLSFADVAMAAALQFVEPLGEEYLRIPPAIRQAFTHQKLSEEFKDLLDWRNRLYSQVRKKRVRPTPI
jgi:glutathione S-transferase